MSCSPKKVKATFPTGLRVNWRNKVPKTPPKAYTGKGQEVDQVDHVGGLADADAEGTPLPKATGQVKQKNVCVTVHFKLPIFL